MIALDYAAPTSDEQRLAEAVIWVTDRTCSKCGLETFVAEEPEDEEPAPLLAVLIGRADLTIDAAHTFPLCPDCLAPIVAYLAAS